MDLKRGLRGWWIALLAAGIDRVAKRLAEGLSGPVTLIPGVLRLRRVENRGMAFSMLSGRGALISLATAALIAALVVWLLRDENQGKLARTGLWMIVGGGLGNLWDRLTAGAVTDFIELLFVRFAVFNPADVFICLGAALTVAGYWRGMRD